MNVIGIASYIEKRERKMLEMEVRENQKNVLSSIYKTEVMDRLSSEKKGLLYTPRDAAREAEEILDIAFKAGCYDEKATPVVKIAEAFGITLRRTSRMLPNMSGVIYAGGNTAKVYGSSPIIFTDDTEPFGHQRFVVIHELAHYLFDYIGNPDRPDQNHVFVENYPRKNHSSDKETRADRFAAALLMPKILFMKQYTIAMEESNNRIYTIKYLSKYFQVKESSVEKRIGEVLYNGGY